MHLTEKLYEGVISVAAPFVGLGLSMHQRGKILLSQRFGNDIHFPIPCEFWGHGASAGEVKGLLPILKNLTTKDKIFITMTSPTGFEALGGVQGALLPFDSRFYLRSLVDNIRCKAFLIGESEFWPVLLGRLQKKRVPIILVNGRLTEGTYKRFTTFKIFQRALSKISLFCVEDERSANYLSKLGVKAELIRITGNAKYDSHLPEVSKSDKAALKERFNLKGKQICSIGSIRPGEEEIIFKAISLLQSKRPNISYIIAPRHKERFDFFAQSLKNHGISYERFTNENRLQTSVLLLDTFGKLEDAYAISDLAIIGGTFIPEVGGHNPLEAAAFEIPVAVGQFHEKIEPLIGNGDSIQILKAVEDVTHFIENIDSENKFILGRKAKEVWDKQQGVAEKTAEIIRSIL